MAVQGSGHGDGRCGYRGWERKENGDIAWLLGGWRFWRFDKLCLDLVSVELINGDTFIFSSVCLLLNIGRLAVPKQPGISG